MKKVVFFIIAFLSFISTSFATNMTPDEMVLSHETLSNYLNNSKRYSSKGHPKAYDLNIEILYPSLWIAEEGKRPHIVQKFTDIYGNGCFLGIQELPETHSPTFWLERTKNTDIIKQQILADIANANDLKVTPTKYSGVPGDLIEFNYQSSQAGVSVFSNTILHILFYKNKRITLDCSTTGFSKEATQLLMDIYYPTFRAIGNDIILQNKYTESEDGLISESIEIILYILLALVLLIPIIIRFHYKNVVEKVNKEETTMDTTQDNQDNNNQIQQSKSILDYFTECISTKYFSFKGRACRKEFFGFLLVSIILAFIINIIVSIAGDDNLLNITDAIIIAILFIPYTAVLVRRFHDLNLSGWWVLLPPVFIAVMMCVESVFFSEVATISDLYLITPFRLIYRIVNVILILAINLFVPAIKGNSNPNKYGDHDDNDKHFFLIYFLVFFIAIIKIAMSIFTGYSTGMVNYKVNKTIDQINLITRSTHSLFSGSKDYTALEGYNINKLVVNARLMPEEMYDADGFKNVFGGKVTLRSGGKYSADDHEAFIIKYEDIPEEECIKLATQNWMSYSDGKFIAMMVTHKGIEGKFNEFTLSNCRNQNSTHPEIPVSVTCSSIMPEENAVYGCKGDSNTLVFKFY